MHAANIAARASDNREQGLNYRRRYVRAVWPALAAVAAMGVLSGCRPCSRDVSRAELETGVPGETPGERRAAVRGVTDAGELARIALGARCPVARMTAVRLLADGEVPAQAAVQDDDPLVRRAAAALINDPELLAQIAVEDPDPRVSRAAVLRLSGENLLARVAAEAASPVVRYLAVYRMSDTSRFAEIAEQDPSPSLRRMAVGRISDQRQLERFATRDSCPEIRAQAVSRVEDPSVLRRIAGEDPYAAVRQAAADRVEWDEWALHSRDDETLPSLSAEIAAEQLSWSRTLSLPSGRAAFPRTGRYADVEGSFIMSYSGSGPHRGGLLIGAANPEFGPDGYFVHVNMHDYTVAGEEPHVDFLAIIPATRTGGGTRNFSASESRYVAVPLTTDGKTVAERGTMPLDRDYELRFSATGPTIRAALYTAGDNPEDRVLLAETSWSVTEGSIGPGYIGFRHHGGGDSRLYISDLHITPRKR